MSDRDRGFDDPASGPPRTQAPVSRRRRRPHAFHFGLGSALARSFQCFGRNLPVLTLFAFVLFVPLAVFKLGAADRVWNGQDEWGRDFGGLVQAFFWARTERELGVWGNLFELAMPLLLQAAVTLGVFQYLRGERVQYSRSLGRGVARLLPVIGVVVFTGLLIFLAMIPAGLILGGMVTAGSEFLAYVAAIGVLAVALLIVCVFFVAIQAAVVERVGPAKAMSRSSALTSGARWKIFAILILLGLIGFFVDVLIQNVLIGQAPSSWGVAQMGIYVSLAVAALLAVFQAVTATVIYHDLRHAKEGVGIDELMRVFD